MEERLGDQFQESERYGELIPADTGAVPQGTEFRPVHWRLGSRKGKLHPCGRSVRVLVLPSRTATERPLIDSLLFIHPAFARTARFDRSTRRLSTGQVRTDSSIASTSVG